MGQALAVAGKRSDTLKMLGTLMPPHPATETLACGVTPGCTSPWALATFLTALGDKDEAFRWLEQAYAQRFPILPTLRVDPAFDSLRSDPRFGDLLRRLGRSGVTESVR